jgi:hypothetical protein
MASSNRAPPGGLSPAPRATAPAVRPPPETCVVTIVVPLDKGHDHTTNSPNMYRVEVKMVMRDAPDPPTALEKAVSVCVRGDTAVLHLQHRTKAYENKFYETIASELKAALEQLECTSSDDDDESEKEEGDFSDDDAVHEAKRRKLEKNRDDDKKPPVPMTNEIRAEHLKSAVTRKDDDTYRRVGPLKLKPTQASLVVFWELCDEELSAGAE